MKCTVANTPINRNQLSVSKYFGTNVLRNLSDDSKVQFLHKPYANDYAECMERVKKLKNRN